MNSILGMISTLAKCMEEEELSLVELSFTKTGIAFQYQITAHDTKTGKDWRTPALVTRELLFKMRDDQAAHIERGLVQALKREVSRQRVVHEAEEIVKGES